MSGKRLFILRDFADRDLPYILGDLKDAPPAGVASVIVPGLSAAEAQQGEVFRANVQPEIENATHVLAFVDTPNANVAFEIGFGLGKGRPLALTRRGAAPPAWLGRSPFKALLVPRATTRAELEDVVRSGASLAAPRAHAPGGGTLLLCPSEGHGQSLRAKVTKVAPGWTASRDPTTPMADVVASLDGMQEVVWVITTHGEGEPARDGSVNASHALLAGLALGRGLRLRVLRQSDARKVVDVEHLERVFADPAAFAKAVEELAAPPPSTASVDPLAAYRAWVVGQHRMLVAFAPELHDVLLADTCVEVAIEERSPDLGSRAGIGEQGAGRALRSGTLREILEAGDGATAPRWLVVGEPGAGKTTMARDLARRMAAAADDPLPIYVPLARFAEHVGDPLDFLTDDLAATVGSDDARLVAGMLRARLDVSRGVWVFFDGLDEVPSGRAVEARRRIEAFRQAHAQAAVVVLTRPIAVEARGALHGFRSAVVQPLPEAKQAQLLQRLVGAADQAEALERVVRGNPRLSEMARNPFLLTLIALVGKAALAAGRAVPSDRAKLYGEAVTLLLEQGYGLEPRPVRAPVTLRRVLGLLSLRLHEKGGEAWKPTDLLAHLRAIRQADKDLDFDVQTAWGTHEALLSDLGTNSGILGPHDGLREPWRFLHRSLREFLAAEAVTQGGAKATDQVVKSWLAAQDAGRPRSSKDTQGLRSKAESWGEVYGLACGLAQDPLAPLRRLRAARSGLALRTLRTLERVTPEARVAFLFESSADWDADDLLSAAASFPNADAAHAVLFPHVTPEQSLEVLAGIWGALEALGRPPEREAFFRACGRWPRGGRFPSIAFADIPAGRFLMGSPADEEGRREWEGPQHEVRVPAFSLACTPVTLQQWHAFDRGKAPTKAEVTLPACDVSWWAARLFCVWMGVRLPSEAEWEYACRAGTRTRFWSGDSEEDLARVAWFGEGSRGRPHPVGAKPANPWGLYDMHGNVWEWCQDAWHANYLGAPTDGSAWEGPASAPRVFRGGGWDDSLRSSRSAFRLRLEPSFRDRVLGFRVARAVTAP